MLTYAAAMAAGTILCFALYALRLRASGGKAAGALITLPAAAVCGLLGARVGYVLLQLMDELGYYGVSALWRFAEDAQSFVLGAVGVCAGVALCARFTGLSRGAALDAFAPAGALLAAVFRIGEHWLGSWGLGGLADKKSPLAFFPIAVQFDAGYGRIRTMWAVCFWAAAVAVAVMIIFLVRRKDRQGLLFDQAAFALLLPQVLLESLRSRGIKWGFVRAEQVLCGILILLIVLSTCRRTPLRLGFWRKYWPGFGIFGCALVIVGIEFIIGKPTLVPFAMTPLANYSVMAAALAGMAAIYAWCLRRLRGTAVSWQKTAQAGNAERKGTGGR